MLHSEQLRDARANVMYGLARATRFVLKRIVRRSSVDTEVCLAKAGIDVQGLSGDRDDS